MTYNASDFTGEIEDFLELIETYLNNTMQSEILDYRVKSFGYPYRIIQELSILSTSRLETIPNKLPIIEHEKSRKIRRY